MNLRTTSNGRIDAAAVAALVAFSAVAYFAGFEPVARAKLAHRELATELGAEQAASGEIAATADALRRRHAKLAEDLRASSISLEPASMVNDRIARIMSAAAEAGLSIEMLQPGVLEARERFGVMPVLMTARGTYRQCAGFLRRLDGTFRDLGVRAMDLAPGAAGDTPRFSVELAWYVLPADGKK